jgi:signal recognition particle subunit SRP54
MLENLTERLSKVVKGLRGQARLTDDNIQDALREVRLALLEADVALPVVRDFVAIVKEKAVGEEVVGSLTPGQALVGVVHRELTALMGGQAVPLSFATQPPAVILLWPAGFGQTTTAEPRASCATSRRKGPLVSADVYRPAAIDNCAPGQVGVDFIRPTPASSLSHRFGALTGRASISRCADRRHGGAVGRGRRDDARDRGAACAVHPIETLFVVDGCKVRTR